MCHPARARVAGGNNGGAIRHPNGHHQRKHLVQPVTSMTLGAGFQSVNVNLLSSFSSLRHRLYHVLLVLDTGVRTGVRTFAIGGRSTRVLANPRATSARRRCHLVTLADHCANHCTGSTTGGVSTRFLT